MTESLSKRTRAIDPKRRSGDYESVAARVEFLGDSYAGGGAYSPAKYLDRYPREIGEQYDARKQRAYLLNYVSAVVDAYIAAVFKRDAVREAPGSLEDFVADATGDGQDLSKFVRESMTQALAMLTTYVVVDVDDEGIPYTHILHPANLLDHAKDRHGNFLWALVAEKFVMEEDPFAGRAEEDRLRLWTPDEWLLFDDKGKPLDEGDNEAGEVPIITVVPGNMPLPIYDIAKINKRIYNISSQIDEILNNVTFPMPYVQSGEGVESAETGEGLTEQERSLVLSTSRALSLPTDASMPPGYLAPPDGPIQRHMEERENLISAIYSLAGLERKDPDTQRVQSGVAKAYDFRETNSRLVSIADAAERVEEEIFELLNAYGFDGEANVSYQKDFNVREFALMLDDYIKISETNLPPAVKRRFALELAGQVAEDATVEEKKEIQEAVENMPDSDFATISSAPVDKATGEPLEGPPSTASRAEQLFSSLRSRSPSS